jgi:hypothetical protein
MLSPAMSRCSFCIVHAIHCEQSPEMHFLNEPNKKIDTEKDLISVLWSVNGIYSLIDVPKRMT